MNADQLALGLLWYVVFLFSTTCHEAAHAWAAKLGGDLTAFHGGQVSLDPIPHIRREPFGMVLMPILTFITGGWMMGWASAPYDPDWSYRHPRRAALMALAGPAANLALVIFAGLAIWAGIAAHIFRLPESIGFTSVVQTTRSGAPDALATLLSILFSLNLVLGTFNLLPLPPLDGFAACALILPETTARRFIAFGHSIRQFSFAGLLLGWKLFDVLYDPIFSFALRLLYPSARYS